MLLYVGKGVWAYTHHMHDQSLIHERWCAARMTSRDQKESYRAWCGGRLSHRFHPPERYVAEAMYVTATHLTSIVPFDTGWKANIQGPKQGYPGEGNLCHLAAWIKRGVTMATRVHACHVNHGTAAG